MQRFTLLGFLGISSCRSVSTLSELRDALADTGVDTIQIYPSVSAQPISSSSLRITGNRRVTLEPAVSNASATLNGDSSARIFDINLTTGANVIFRDLTIAGGRAKCADGGCDVRDL